VRRDGTPFPERTPESCNSQRREGYPEYGPGRHPSPTRKNYSESIKR